ncbi:hypothetical protein SRHO_G00056240 [Serrasalmus rhombeus]
MEMLTSLLMLVVTGYLKEDRIIPRMHHTVPVCGRPTVDLSKHDRVLGGNKAPADSSPRQKFAKEHVKVYVGDNHVS